MRPILAILICSIGISAYAIDFTTTQAIAPTSTMQSVNNNVYMSSGSTYSAEVYDVGAYSPSQAAGVRKSPPGKDDSGYDPNNPQFAPLGDALFPLLIMASAFAVFTYFRRRRQTTIR